MQFVNQLVGLALKAYMMEMVDFLLDPIDHFVDGF